MARRKRDDGNKAKVIMSVIIALLMVLSVFGIIIGSYTSELKFGKHKFEQNVNGYYTTQLEGKEVIFYTLPGEYMPFTENSISKIKNAALLITTFDPNTANESVPYIEVARFDIANTYPDKSVFTAVSSYSDAYAALPILDCQNATEQVPIIVFNISDLAGVYDYGDCIYMNGRGTDFLRMRDRLLYEYYGIVKNGNITQ